MTIADHDIFMEQIHTSNSITEDFLYFRLVEKCWYDMMTLHNGRSLDDRFVKNASCAMGSESMLKPLAGDASWTGGRHLWGNGVPEVGDLLVHSSKRLVTMVRNQKLRRVDCCICYVTFWVGRLWVQTVCQQQSCDKWHLLLMFIKFLQND